MISRYFVYKQALLKEAERLVQANVIHEKEDIYYLTFEEAREVVRTNQLNYQIISQRKNGYKHYEYEKGMVIEVGGLMIHVAVIAREYGLSTVVGVENATKRIKDGRRIRVNGTGGYVEILFNETRQ